MIGHALLCSIRNALPLALVLGALLACKKEEKKPEVQINAGQDQSGITVTTPQGKVEIGTSGTGGATAGIKTPAGTVGATSGDCKAGDKCVCNGMGACSKKCAGGGCQFECHGMGACNFDCPDGKCTVESDAMGSVNLQCPGNDCTLTCKGTGTCSLGECKSGCKVECKGVGTCSCSTGC